MDDRVAGGVAEHGCCPHADACPQHGHGERRGRPLRSGPRQWRPFAVPGLLRRLALQFSCCACGYLLFGTLAADNKKMIAALLLVAFLGVLFGVSFAVKLLIWVAMGWGFFWIIGKRVKAGRRSRS